MNTVPNIKFLSKNQVIKALNLITNLVKIQKRSQHFLFTQC